MFKEKFPENFRAYAAACERGEMQLGHVFVTEHPNLVGEPRWSLNFPTKQHWRNRTRIEWIESGLELLATIDWLLTREGRRPEPEDIKEGLAVWPGARKAGERKLRIFDDRLIALALERLTAESETQAS